MKLSLILLATVLDPAVVFAQGPSKHLIYIGGMGGFATLSGDGSAVVTPSSASTSLFDPKNGAAAEGFVGIHHFEYVSFQADYVWNRNSATFFSNSQGHGGLSFYKWPESITQHAFLGNVLIYFRKRSSRIRPYLAVGTGAALIHSRLSGTPIVVGNPVLPPSASDHASIAWRTAVGLDASLGGRWYFRYSFGETITRNTLGDQFSPAEHRIPKNFQNFFGIVFRF